VASVPPEASARSLLERARARVAQIPDPEIPVVTLLDLGILRDVRMEGERLVVTLTPTYTGCPATQVIAQEVRDTLAADGLHDAEVRLTLSPPWTTDWITDEGRRKLRAYGIAPPARVEPGACPIGGPGAGPAPDASGASNLPVEAVLRFVPHAIACPQCGSASVERLSEYGSTPCKALYRCLDCREPFDYFKPY